MREFFLAVYINGAVIMGVFWYAPPNVTGGERSTGEKIGQAVVISITWPFSLPGFVALLMYERNVALQDKAQAAGKGTSQ